jgi:hypothetical protein
MSAIPFKKCVDPSAVIVVSTMIKGLEAPAKLQLPKPARAKVESLIEAECD